VARTISTTAACAISTTAARTIGTTAARAPRIRRPAGRCCSPPALPGAPAGICAGPTVRTHRGTDTRPA
jgi:hypothetical protein